MIGIAEKLGACGLDTDAKARLVEGYRRAAAVPVYVRDAVKALERALATGGPEGGAARPRASGDTRSSTEFAANAAGGPALPLSDTAMEQGLAEVGITTWGPRAEDWTAGAQYAVRLLREYLRQAAAQPLQDRVNEARHSVAWRVIPAAPPAPRPNDDDGAVATRPDLDAGTLQQALADLVAECTRADAQAAREVQRTFINPVSVKRAHSALKILKALGYERAALPNDDVPGEWHA